MNSARLSCRRFRVALLLTALASTAVTSAGLAIADPQAIVPPTIVQVDCSVGSIQDALRTLAVAA